MNRHSSTPLLLLFLFVITLSACNRSSNEPIVNGVSGELARERKTVISRINYDLFFNIPETLTQKIEGSVKVTFDLKTEVRNLQLDFRADSDQVSQVIVNGVTTKCQIYNGHIIIPGLLPAGENRVQIEFLAGDLSLNRNVDFLYTLLVPDRAATLFPCFDQPDLKASFRLRLEIPSEWKAMANSDLDSTYEANGRKSMIYQTGKPISTYLFAFTAGRFESLTAEVDGLEMEMLHRETDIDLVNRNKDEIFSLHAEATRWLEEYTGIPYPFEKFGFVLIPSFQYGGMEHPGTIFYRASTLFLQPDASINQKLSRAGLIAHETSHMWFGDLVTMKWFDDVWLKEVFAGYMADKIVNPSFPEVNHDLKFLLTRYPAAYAVDRTRGANPVIQPLKNLLEAGTLYGGIIYNKAPVIMKHLELMLGEEKLRLGLREYLSMYSYDNAEWADLVSILQNHSQENLVLWSNVWVREPGMPEISIKAENLNGVTKVHFTETDPGGKDRFWPQTFSPMITNKRGEIATGTIRSGENESISINGDVNFIIPDRFGIAYGSFVYDSSNISALALNVGTIEDPVTRGFIWLTLWENMLNGRVQPEVLLTVMSREIMVEKEKQLTAFLRNRISTLYWNRIPSESRYQAEIELTSRLRTLYEQNNDPAERKSIFKTWSDIALSKASLDSIADILSGVEIPKGLKLSEDERITLAGELLLKGYGRGEELYDLELNRTVNPDRKAKMAFIKPSLSADQATRDLFFNSLLLAENREREPWVIEALGYLHHPLRSSHSEIYIPESLQIIREIQMTGDIFFPFNWLAATFTGHRSSTAFDMVNDFLNDNSDLPESLRLKILQTTDHLYRSYGSEAK